LIAFGFFIWPERLLEPRVRFHKDGSTKMHNSSTVTRLGQLCAGIDVSKDQLDIALSSGLSLACQSNDEPGHEAAIAALKAHGVEKVGIEATGGYERAVVKCLRAHGFKVHVFQPQQVHAYAKYKLKRAKSDKLDAVLIAQCMADCSELRDPPDPRLAAFAEHLTFIEQIEEDIARWRIRAEHARLDHVQAGYKAEIKQLLKRRREELKLLQAGIEAQADLKTKLTLITSIKGVGRRTAIAMVVRMPELGSLSREQAASLLGAAPFIQQTGKYQGQRHVAGGRARPRTALFACAQAAVKWNPHLKAFYERLRQAGKPYALAIMACTRKLIILINTVLARATPWTENPPDKTSATAKS
jgi:transposase